MRRATYNTVNGSTIFGEQHNNIERHCKMKGSIIHYEESDIQYSERQYDIRRATQQYWATLQNEGSENTLWGERHTIQWTAVRYAESNTTILCDTTKWREREYNMRRATYNTVNGSTICGEQHNNIERHCKMKGSIIHYEESDIQYSERQYDMRRATQQYWATLQNEGIDNTLWGERHTIQWTAVRYSESNTTILSDTAKWRDRDYNMRRSTYNIVSGRTICGEKHNNIERHCKMNGSRIHYEESDIQYSERQYDMRRATQKYWATMQKDASETTLWGEQRTI